MLNSIKRLFFRRPLSVDEVLMYPEGKRYYREQHELRRENMDPDALKVVNRLNRGGYRSYLVGGCVRDMLLGRHPKDFDVVTSATPSQIRTLFSNSRTIGRRFKIVHVVFRGHVIEVSTFRSLPEHRLRGKTPSPDLLMQRDNEFGNAREDAARRDFSINALFFDPRNESIIDYVGGLEDVQNRVIRIIGDPDMSFREDPVRMLRAAKFSALLDFTMDPTCVRAIKKHAGEISKASPSRMLEEYGKIFRTGRASAVFGAFHETGLLKALLPETWAALKGPERKGPFLDTPVGRRLATADKMLTEREDLTTTIYFGLLFADVLRKVLDGQIDKNIVDYIRSRLDPLCRRIQLPVRDKDRLIEVFASQPRFKETRARRKFKPEFFRQKIFFFEAFMIYKIIAISRRDEEGMQRAMFWEIGPRVRPPESGKAISLFVRRHQRPGGRPPERGGRDRADRGGRGGRPDQAAPDRGERDRAGAARGGRTGRTRSEQDGEKRGRRRPRGRRPNPEQGTESSGAEGPAAVEGEA